MLDKPPIVALSDMIDGQEGDLFALMTKKETALDRNGKAYFRVAFRDKGREVNFPLWENSPWTADCRDRWAPGLFFKIRAVYRETDYGPQLDIQRIREVNDTDAEDGFDPSMCLPQSRFDQVEMFDELCRTVEQHVTDTALQQLVLSILTSNREELLPIAAARRNHHAYAGGLLEHTLSVTRTCVYLAEKYATYYPDMTPPLDRGLVVAGAVLHDIGKLRELDQGPQGATYTAAGAMIGHLLMGRDMVREAAADLPPGSSVDAETCLRLEHLIIAHQRLPEWGSPKPPMTPEAMIVHYADDLDAKFHMMVAILDQDTNAGPMTSRKNILAQQVFRGLGEI